MLIFYRNSIRNRTEIVLRNRKAILPEQPQDRLQWKLKYKYAGTFFAIVLKAGAHGSFKKIL